MAGVSVEGNSGRRRSLDSEINMIPMIDLLMVTISFLLITAVWVHASRMEASANAPAADAPPCEGAACKPEPRLHVDAKDPSKFVLSWKDGRTVIRTAEVPRDASRSKAGVAFPALAAKIQDEWRSAGAHRDASDRAFDHAVVHAANDMPYAEMVGVMDAVASPKRVVGAGGKVAKVPAFAMTFATD